MKPSQHLNDRARSGGNSIMSRVQRRAFTMIEIAIALAVIGFALVAIIGILPFGMNVQKDNREDTIINQDGPYLLEAIRGGQHGLDALTNYFDSVTIVVADAAGMVTNVYTNKAIAGNWLTNGEVVVGLLSTPKYMNVVTATGTNWVTNYVTANVRAMTGSALEQNGANRAVAFNYYVRSEILSYNPFDTNRTNYLVYYTQDATQTNEWLPRSNYWWQAQVLSSNLYEVRLKFSWPLLPNGDIGPNRQLFRTLVSGKQEKVGYFGNPNTPGADQQYENLYFFQPLKYTQAGS